VVWTWAQFTSSQVRLSMGHNSERTASSSRGMQMSAGIVRIAVIGCGAILISGHLPISRLTMPAFLALYTGVVSVLDMCVGAANIKRRINKCRTALAAIQAVFDRTQVRQNGPRAPGLSGYSFIATCTVSAVLRLRPGGRVGDTRTGRANDDLPLEGQTGCECEVTLWVDA
jgi:hypothetical protein